MDGFVLAIPADCANVLNNFTSLTDKLNFIADNSCLMPKKSVTRTMRLVRMTIQIRREPTPEAAGQDFFGWSERDEEGKVTRTSSIQCPLSYNDFEDPRGKKGWAESGYRKTIDDVLDYLVHIESTDKGVDPVIGKSVTGVLISRHHCTIDARVVVSKNTTVAALDEWLTLGYVGDQQGLANFVISGVTNV